MTLYRPDGWLPGEGIPELISGIYQPIGIEVGTNVGWTTEYLLNSNPMMILHGVDPYTPYVDWDGTHYGEGFHNDSYQELMSRVGNNANRYIHHRKTSDDAVADFEDDSFDFIFLDGVHTYEQVLKDCHNYYPKLRKGGLFCGHDMTNVAGVGKAVMQFSQIVGRGVSLTRQDVWYFYK